MTLERRARVGQGVRLALTWAGLAMVVALIAATGLGVIARYLRIGGVSWSYELSGMAFLWVTAIGTVVSEIMHENVSIDGTTSDRGPWLRRYHALVLLGVAVAFVWSGYAMLKRTGFMPTPVMRAPSWTIQSTIIAMGVGLGAVAILRLLRVMR